MIWGRRDRDSTYRDIIFPFLGVIRCPNELAGLLQLIPKDDEAVVTSLAHSLDEEAFRLHRLELLCHTTPAVR